MYLVIFILILVCLIVVHEYGHFTAAKLFGIRVDEFGIGFPPRIFGIKIGETLYSLNILLLGGFVRIFGETSDDTAGAPELRKRSFVHKPKRVQAAVIIAGILCNLIFAWLIISVGYLVGLPSDTQSPPVFGHISGVHTTITAVTPNSPAALAGIQAGDIVEGAQSATAVLPSPVSSQGLEQFIAAHDEQSILLTLSHNGEKEIILAKPVSGILPNHKAIGIALDDVGVVAIHSPLAFVQGGVLFWQMTEETAEGLWSFFASIFHGTADFSDVAGPIGIATIGASAVQQGFAPTIILTALISINLALINILPIPGLDGGRLLFILIEKIQRRALSEQLAVRLTIAGFSLLLLLLLIISYHDIVRLLHP